MANLEIAHHERVGRHPHRWLVHVHGRSKPIPVELPEEERAALDLDEDQIHALLPTAFLRRHERHPDDPPAEPEHGDDDVNWDAPVRVYQMHFMQ
jgi:hypothetical protein